MFPDKKQLSRKESQIAPKVVDFGTLSDQHEQDHVIEKTVNVSTPRSGALSAFWPLRWFSRTNQQQTPSEKGHASCHSKLDESNKVRSPTDKVIAMKKLKTENSSEEFIDVEYKQLSYAEAASLRVAQESEPKSALKKHNNSIVVDQDDDLEKSITDVELAEAAKKNTRYVRA
ncbi:hypothetical protein HII13_003864 [Brettanomyces bruxellensis]|uniref:DEBR0S1_15676g1_1 n=1 Tax=Dekkera bruxellensis TaxID=5007 RepID=A0A7D9CWI9_DEKBR|nr:hypothetical protein HII13_003864 [Brettanomyces bruxellensis]VUG16390.1 DEBR0S1_15676g1_1 [Brettanomyces bruxellensis]